MPIDDETIVPKYVLGAIAALLDEARGYGGGNDYFPDCVAEQAALIEAIERAMGEFASMAAAASAESGER